MLLKQLLSFKYLKLNNARKFLIRQTGKTYFEQCLKFIFYCAFSI